MHVTKTYTQLTDSTRLERIINTLRVLARTNVLVVRHQQSTSSSQKNTASDDRSREEVLDLIAHSVEVENFVIQLHSSCRETTRIQPTAEGRVAFINAIALHEMTEESVAVNLLDEVNDQVSKADLTRNRLAMNKTASWQALWMERKLRVH